MQRNSNKCAHCGETFARVTERIPVINRSDGESFHVALFSGPDRRAGTSGRLYAGQVNCGFVYVHNRTRPQIHFVVVVIMQAKQQEKEALEQVEDVTDKIASLLLAGKKLGAVYTSDDGQFTPGFPK